MSKAHLLGENEFHFRARARNLYYKRWLPLLVTGRQEHLWDLQNALRITYKQQDLRSQDAYFDAC